MGLWLRRESPSLGIWKIEESEEELLSLLDHKEWYLPFLERTISDKRKREWLSVRVLLKELTGKELEISYHSNGAPFLRGGFLQISISHTSGYAAVLLSPQAPVAIDIERYADRVLRLHERYLSGEELKALSSVQPTHSLLYWSAKETLFKLIGRQEVDFREHLYIYPFECAESGIFRAEERRTKERKSYDIHYRVTPDFVLTYAVS